MSGNTLPHRTLLREAGGTWNRLDQCWKFAGEDPMAKFAAVIDAASADSGPPAVPAPHYRGRLHGRVLKADIEPLPNYELPGLLLFYSIERIDTEPLAKCLIEASRRSVTSSPPNPPSCASSRSTSERWRGRKSHVSFRKNVLIA